MTACPELEASLELARAAWPGIDVDEAKFAAHLANVIVDDMANLRHVSDLYLAFGCACGDKRALTVLETHYVPRLRAPLLRIGIPASAIDETVQLIRVEVLVAQPPRRPRIMGYGGHGRLQGWLHAVGVRTGLRCLRKAHRYQGLDDDHVELGTGLELEYMQRTYGDAFRKAFATAVAGLAPDDRLLLKQRFQHRTGVEDLGRQYGVHAATITRRVQSARDGLGRPDLHRDDARALGGSRGARKHPSSDPQSS